MVFGGGECVGGGYLELEVLILYLAVNWEETSDHKKNLNLSKSSLSESRENTLREQKTPNTTEHFNQPGIEKP